MYALVIHANTVELVDVAGGEPAHAVVNQSAPPAIVVLLDHLHNATLLQRQV